MATQPQRQSIAASAARPDSTVATSNADRLRITPREKVLPKIASGVGRGITGVGRAFATSARVACRTAARLVVPALIIATPATIVERFVADDMRSDRAEQQTLENVLAHTQLNTGDEITIRVVYPSPFWGTVDKTQAYQVSGYAAFDTDGKHANCHLFQRVHDENSQETHLACPAAPPRAPQATPPTAKP